MKRIAILLVVLIFMFSFAFPVSACDEEQTDLYITQVVFGDQTSKYESDESFKALLSALYLCSEQHDNLGYDELDRLKKIQMGSIPSLEDINITGDNLLECSHNSWEYEYVEAKKVQNNRKKVLRRTVNKIFDFGMFNKLFNANNEKCNSFSAFLYYMHILSDYIADDPDATEIIINDRSIPSYAGNSCIELNENIPLFTDSQKRDTMSFAQYESLDSLGRCGVAFANIGIDNMAPPDSRQDIGNIKPAGWFTVKYPGYVNSYPAYLYNRCHLIAHQLNGNDTKENLITGTRYLNEVGMKPYEDMVAKYVKKTGNHVLYRATPIFEGDSLVASGVQLEAYSVEDSGKGICFNVYCYNVQPGVAINYMNGLSEVSDEIYYADNSIAFVNLDSDNSKPDLINAVNKHLAVLFEDQKDSYNYISMMNEISEVAIEAGTVGDKGETEAQQYIKLKEYEYRYFNILKKYVPELLKNEDFFSSKFKQ